MPTYEDVLREAKKRVRRARLEASAAELLFMHFSGLKPTELYLKLSETMPNEAIDRFDSGLQEYILHHRPIQYITGEMFFFGYALKVNENVLIPRFETEELVEKVLTLYDGMFAAKSAKVLDLCTGSGCIAIAIKKEAPACQVFASDISPAALAIARENATKLDAPVVFYEGDLFEPLANETFDIIVANPPYIPDTEKVADIIFDHEPHLALFGGKEGLDFYRRILVEAPKHLNRPGILAFEHAYHSASKIREWAALAFPKADIYTEKDMQDKDRMTFVILR
jgi:release factor glutamine methyltransferase